jgi:hypothetical protein
MQELSKIEMLKVKGGGLSAWGFFGIGTFLSFLAGIVDGFARPFKCN